jgi:hypothetical protein
LIRLPARVVRAPGPYPSSHVVQMLHQAADMFSADRDADESLVTLEANTNGIYQIAADPVANPRGADEDGVDEEDANDEAGDHRQVVFLDARALLHAR